MKRIRIADAEVVVLALQDQIRRSEESRYDHRLHGVLMVAQGLSCTEVARFLADAPRTAAYWVQGFEEEGLAGLAEGDRPGRPGRLSPEQLQIIGGALRGDPTEWGLPVNLWDGKTLSEFIARGRNIALGSVKASVCLTSSDFACENRDPRSPMLILSRRRNIKKLHDLARDDTTDLWSIDGSFQLHGPRCRMWIPREVEEPVVYHNPTRKGIGYFGAVRLRDGKFVFHRAEKFNAESFFLFVRDLRTISCRSGRKVAIILENAKYHHAKLHEGWREKSVSRFALNFLLPYSPGLNPIERVWKLVRRLATHNRYFADLNEIIAAVERTLWRWRPGSGTLRRLCAIT